MSVNRLSGRVAVVTGGTRGLGFAIARAYGHEGAKAIVVASRSQDSVDSALAALRDEGFEAAGLSVDVAVRSQVEALRDLACETYGTVDVWVNNAGLSSPYGPVHEVPTERFLESTDTVIRGTYFGSLAALDVFVPRGSGHLVNLLGRGDKGKVPNQAAYAAAKAWVRSFTLSLAAEQRGTGIQVHAFNPGLVTTDMLGHVSAVRGHEGGLARFPMVVSMLGRSAEEAALPAVDLVCGDKVEHQTLRPLGMLRSAVSYGAARLAKRPREVLPMTVTTVEPRD